ncbi:hypothetical protein COB57_02045 [Candidatus Peregrinibacteria bacterium]|nr:MAG: hypothetical protein COB57_02045 [Candidatus Peregrinibacteria bacterium]
MIFGNINVLHIGLIVFTALLFIVGLFIAMKKYRKKPPLVFAFFSFVFALFAILDPLGGISLQSAEQENIPVFFLLDISQSMNAQDSMYKSRLTSSKILIKNVINQSPNNIYSLMLFAGDAYTVIPFTHDHQAFASMLQNISTDDIHTKGSDINAALAEGIQRIEATKKSAVFVLISDGDDGSTLDPNIEKKLAQYNIPVISVGVGSIEGAKIPTGQNPFGRMFYKTFQGKTVVSKLSTQILQNISAASGGKYFHFKQENNDQDLIQLIQSHGVSEKNIWEKQEQEKLYQYFLFLSFLFFIAFLFSPLKRFMPLLSLIFLFSSCTVAPSEASVELYEYQAQKENKYTQAEYFNQNLQEITPGLSTAYNRGRYAYNKKQYEKASNLFQQSIQNTCPHNETPCQLSWYNLGNSLYKSAEFFKLEDKIEIYKKSIESYDNALSFDPLDEETLANKNFVLEKLKKDLEEQQKREDEKLPSPENQSSDAQDGEGQDREKQGEADNSSPFSQMSEKEMQGYMDTMESNEKQFQQYFHRIPQKEKKMSEVENSPLDYLMEDPFFKEFFESSSFFDGKSGEKDW